MRRDFEPPPCGVWEKTEIRAWEVGTFASKLIKCRLIAPAKRREGLVPTVHTKACQAERVKGVKSTCVLRKQVAAQPRKRIDVFRNQPVISILTK